MQLGDYSLLLHLSDFSIIHQKPHTAMRHLHTDVVIIVPTMQTWTPAMTHERIQNQIRRLAVHTIANIQKTGVRRLKN